MTPASAYRAVLAVSTAYVERSGDIERAYERVFGAYEVAVMVGVREDIETPSEWYARMDKRNERKTKAEVRT